MKEKLLIITSRDSQRTTVKNGGTTLTQSTITALSEHYDVSEIPAIPYSLETGTFKLIEKITRMIFSIWGYSGGLYPWTERRILNQLARENLKYVFIDHSLYGRVARIIKIKMPTIRVITHFHNIEYHYYLSVSGPTMLKKVLSRAAKYNEDLASKYSDKIIALTDRDSQLLQKLYGRTADAIIPICLPNPQILSQKHSLKNLPQKYVFFCGSYFKPNIDGILWFIKNVLPHIDVDLLIAGHNLKKLLPMINNKRVTLINSPPSLAPFYENALAVVAPIFSGTGMKTKTIEALSYGKQVFATDEALVGIEYTDCNDIRLCNSPHDFIEGLSIFLAETTDSGIVPRSNSNYELFLKKYSSTSKSKKIKLIVH